MWNVIIIITEEVKWELRTIRFMLSSCFIQICSVSVLYASFFMLLWPDYKTWVGHFPYLKQMV